MYTVEPSRKMGAKDAGDTKYPISMIVLARYILSLLGAT
jgi:hypothetical protein